MAGGRVLLQASSEIHIRQYIAVRADTERRDSETNQVGTRAPDLARHAAVWF